MPLIRHFGLHGYCYAVASKQADLLFFYIDSLNDFYLPDLLVQCQSNNLNSLNMTGILVSPLVLRMRSENRYKLTSYRSRMSLSIRAWVWLMVWLALWAAATTPAERRPDTGAYMFPYRFCLFYCC